jgi:hypothetical protein
VRSRSACAHTVTVTRPARLRARRTRRRNPAAEPPHRHGERRPPAQSRRYADRRRARAGHGMAAAAPVPRRSLSQSPSQSLGSLSDPAASAAWRETPSSPSVSAAG